MFRFISAHDLIESTDPVQMGIRLLIPQGSLILDVDGIDRHLGAYDSDLLSYTWLADDSEMDQLAAFLMSTAEDAAVSGAEGGETFMAQWLAVVEGTELEVPDDAIDQRATVGRPKLTESWFC